MNTVILLVGPPASGKSTWANNYVKIYSSAVIVCRDDLRAMQGFPPIGNDDQERIVTKIQNGMIEIALAEGRDVVVANTNINKGSRKALIKFAHEHGADVNIVIFDTPLEECIRRNTMRDRVVPGDVIRKMYDSMQAQIKNGSLAAGPIPCPRFAPYRHDDTGRQEVICVDLDGTVAGHRRSPYDYSKVSTDYPIEDVVSVVAALSDKYRILFVSGRPDSCRDDTIGWLRTHLKADTFENGWELHMRKSGDDRGDGIIKNEIYDAEIIPKYNVVAVIDDRDRVVRAIRNRGITVLQANYGRF